MLMIENSLSDFFGSGVGFYILAASVSILIFLIIWCFLLLLLSKAFESICDWLEYKLASRKVRRTYFSAGKKNKSSVKAVGGQLISNSQSKAATNKSNSLTSSRKGRIIDAHNVLRRNAEAYTNRHKN